MKWKTNIKIAIRLRLNSTICHRSAIYNIENKQLQNTCELWSLYNNTNTNASFSKLKQCMRGLLYRLLSVATIVRPGQQQGARTEGRWATPKHFTRHLFPVIMGTTARLHCPPVQPFNDHMDAIIQPTEVLPARNIEIKYNCIYNIR